MVFSNGETVGHTDSSIAGAVYAWGTAKSVYLKPGVVGKAVYVVVVKDVAGLLQGVGFERLSRFGNVCFATDILQREHLYPIGQYLANLRKFVLVVGSKYDGVHVLFLTVFTLMESKPSPKTPMTALCDTKALGSIILMSRKMSVLSRFFARIQSTLRSLPEYQP